MGRQRELEDTADAARRPSVVLSYGELLGNFPQAFTLLALINAAIRLDRALQPGRSSSSSGQQKQETR